MTSNEIRPYRGDRDFASQRPARYHAAMKDIWDIAAALLILFLTFAAGVLAGRMSKSAEAALAPTAADFVDLASQIDFLEHENDRLRRIVEEHGLEDADPYGN